MVGEQQLAETEEACVLEAKVWYILLNLFIQNSLSLE